MACAAALQSNNPFAMVKAAARGSLEAQRALAEEATAALFEGDIGGFYEGLTYARMAASSGGVDDTGRLLQLLVLAAELQDPKDHGALASLAGQYLAIASHSVDLLKDNPEDAAKLEAMLVEAAAQSSRLDLENAKYWEGMLRASEDGKE